MAPPTVRTPTPLPMQQLPPTQQPPVPVPATPPGGLQPSPRRGFSIWEVLSGAAFTGFEGGLLAIAMTSLLVSGRWYRIVGDDCGGLIYCAVPQGDATD